MRLNILTMRQEKLASLYFEAFASVNVNACSANQFCDNIIRQVYNLCKIELLMPVVVNANVSKQI